MSQAVERLVGARRARALRLTLNGGAGACTHRRRQTAQNAAHDEIEGAANGTGGAEVVCWRRSNGAQWKHNTGGGGGTVRRER